jgi:hypothetical protein
MTVRRDLLARLEEARQLEPPRRGAALYEVGRALLISGDAAAGRAGREALLDGADDEPWAAYGAALLLLTGEHGPQDIPGALRLLEKAAPTVAEAALLLAQAFGAVDRGRAEAALAPWAAAGLPAGLSRLGQLHAFHGDDAAAGVNDVGLSAGCGSGGTIRSMRTRARLRGGGRSAPGSGAQPGDPLAPVGALS